MSDTELTSETASADLGQWLSKAVNEDENILENFSDSFGDITEKISETIALKHQNTTAQSVIYYVTNYAILETAQHVFNIGSGFTKLDTTGFTLAQIMQIVKRIEAKVDKMLKEPLNTAIYFFNSAMREIENKRPKDAYNSLDKVIENATKAFYYVSGKKIDSECFQEAVKAIQLLIFARISRYSYDDEKNCFLPFQTLSLNTVKLIGQSLEDLVDKSLDQKKNVKTKNLKHFFGSRFWLRIASW